MRDMVVWGVGELGAWFGGAALRAGIRVTPITRGVRADDVFRALPDSVPVLVAVGERDLPQVLASLPAVRGNSLILLQNELFPAAWEAHGFAPTVLVPWLLKKRGQPELVGRPTRVFGPLAPLVRELHGRLGVASVELANDAAMRQALVEKFAFILAINALGTERDETLGQLLKSEPDRVRALAREGAKLAGALAAATIDEEACVAATIEAMVALSAIAARGRTAGERVIRARNEARRLHIALPELERIAARLG